MADVRPSPPSSGVASPEQRPSSPSPSVSPSLALDAVPQLDRSVSSPTSSSTSVLSTRSRQARRSDSGATVVRRRGYMRPQGTAFADSARNRDSVMSLGSIAHMQYYFARTGLLDGKGAQLARDKKKGLIEMENCDPAITSVDDFGLSSLSLNDGQSSYAISDSGQDQSVMESPSDMRDAGESWNTGSEPPMLPPTVSTYKQKPSYSEPLPDMLVLRRELKEALQDACKVIEESQKHQPESQPDSEESNGFYEIQGLHMLDILTLAIRAAKNYYTAHMQPQRLYAIKTEREIRADLYHVLDILKRMASRNFRGGMRLPELTGVVTWIESIDQLLKQEEQHELREAAERQSWAWREGDWTGREREREWLFLKSFDNDGPALPPLPDRDSEQQMPTDFLKALEDGQRLIRLHNTLVARSKRKFDEIKTWHTDVAKPYRKAENLRFWIKSAELRWEIKLSVPVSEIANSKDNADAWRQFEEAVFKWCCGVREELLEEWRQEAVNERQKPPELKFDMPDARAPAVEEV